MLRLTRRRFLLLSGLLLGARVLRMPGRFAALAEPREATLLAESIRRGRVVLSPADLVAVEARNARVIDGRLGTEAVGEGRAVSTVVEAPLPFSAVGAEWEVSSQRGQSSVALRVSNDSTTWSEWQTLPLEGAPDHAPRDFEYGGLLGIFATPLPRYVQCAVTLRGETTLPALRSLTLHFSDVGGGSASPTPSVTAGLFDRAEIRADRDDLASSVCIQGPAIVSRAGWGCPDGESSPEWPPAYQRVTHLFAHHTATSNTASDWTAWVRAIWDYHANSLGWGDIGYNFLVDPNGVVYEGRAGGDDVVAGHAYGFNSGSLGLAFLGTYSSVPPSSAMIGSAKALLGWRADKRGINPLATAAFLAYSGCSPITYDMPTLLGHRDAPGHNSAVPNVCNVYGPTSCPGDGLWSLLPAIRSDVVARITVTGVVFTPVQLLSGGSLRVDVTVRNDGHRPVWSQGPDPGFRYEEGQSYQSLGYPAQPGSFRVGIDCAQRSQPVDHPYRWGLGCVLLPGTTTTVTGYIRLRTVTTQSYWMGLVQEAVGWQVDNFGTSLITVREATYQAPSIPAQKNI